MAMRVHAVQVCIPPNTESGEKGFYGNGENQQWNEFSCPKYIGQHDQMAMSGHAEGVTGQADGRTWHLRM